MMMMMMIIPVIILYIPHHTPYHGCGGNALAQRVSNADQLGILSLSLYPVVFGVSSCLCFCVLGVVVLPPV